MHGAAPNGPALMPQGPAGWALLAAVALFLGWLLLKSRVSLAGQDPRRAEGRKRLAEAKARARAAKGDAALRARALRDAAIIALEDLGRPNKAASYARRALRADPDDGESIRVVALAMRRAQRYRALEKLLWRRLASGVDSQSEARAFAELLALYEGPMRRPAQAQVLRRLREAATS